MGAVTGFELTEFSALSALPASAASLLDEVGDRNLFTSRIWFETFVSSGISPDAAPLFLVMTDSRGTARALLPCQRLGKDRGTGRPGVAGLTSFYSCDFRPLIAVDAAMRETAQALGRCVARHFSAESVVRFDSLDPAVATVSGFLGGLAAPGRGCLRYEHFGGWTEAVGGASFDAYMAARAGAVREVVRRKGNRLHRAGGTFEMITDGDIEAAIADYDTVYAQSWKEPEPWPRFQPTLIRALAVKGWLRLALCRLEGQPIAAQLWTIVDGRATVLKLAHATANDRLSPGTLLTAFAIRVLMERDRATMLDFGRGDDDYKRAWVRQRTPHIGVLWTSLARRPLMVARHWLSQLRQR